MPVPLPEQPRRRSIRAWLQAKDPKEYARLQKSGELEKLVDQKDAAMMADFWGPHDLLLYHSMKKPNWGTAEAMREFETKKHMLWSQTFSDHLPVLSPMEEEDEEENDEEPTSWFLQED